MFQERYNRIVLPFFFLFDILIVLILYHLVPQVLGLDLVQLKFFLYPALFWIFSSILFKSYRVPRVNSYLSSLRPIFLTWCLFSLFYILTSSYGLLPFWSSSIHGSFLIIVALVQHLFSLLRYNFFLSYRRKGKNARNAIFLGNISSDEMSYFQSDGLHFGYHIIDTFTDLDSYFTDLQTAISMQKVDIVFLMEANQAVTDTISALCDDYGIRLKLLLSLSSGTGRRAGLDTVGGFPLMDVRHEPLLYFGNQAIKRIIDIIMSVLSIIFILTWLPIIVKIAQMFTYPGPLFFTQDRVGRDGNIFKLYKFRTMRISLETKTAQRGLSKKTNQTDPRVPWFGHILRRSNLDEYPQFLNVFMGTMSTVGPRPHMVGEDISLEKHVRRYRMRRFVKPGITGWAAINGYRGGTEDIDLMARRTEHDIWYLENWSLWLDIKIIFITIFQMITFKIPKAY